MRDNLDDEKRKQMKESDKTRKKKMCDNLDDDKREQVRYNDNNRKKDKRIETKDQKTGFNNFLRCSMVDPCILTTLAFKVIEEDCKCAIQEGPTYICDVCWKSEF